MRRIVRGGFAGGLFVGIYVAIYALFSWNGSYVSSQTGNVKVAGGGPLINDVQVWRPRFVRLKISLNGAGQIEREANVLGWVFYPLELLDRRYWHPTKHPFLDLLKGLQRPMPAGGATR